MKCRPKTERDVAGPGVTPVQMEALASMAHEVWADWMSYLFNKSRRHDDGSVTIPAALVDRWSGQMLTPYGDLTEAEKRSDREVVGRYLRVLEVRP